MEGNKYIFAVGKSWFPYYCTGVGMVTKGTSVLVQFLVTIT